MTPSLAGGRPGPGVVATIDELLAAAAVAPSGDNTQPWRFVVDRAAGLIGLELDPGRDPSPMNAGQRMARIALGAALENLLRAARAGGWDAEAVPAPPGLVAMVRLGPARPDGAPRTACELAARVTNRRPYDGRPIPTGVLDGLRRATPDEGVATRWLVGADRLRPLARLISRGDAAIFGAPTVLRAFLANVRLDAAPGVPIAEGLCPASLDLSAVDRLALRALRRAPDWLLRLGVHRRAFASKARRLVAGASGLCLGVARDDDPATDLAVGRTMQRAWLALTAHGLAAQPMMSLPVLDNIRTHGDPALIAALGRPTLERLADEARSGIPELEGGRVGFLLRFGYAPPPRGRTSRLPLDAITRERSDD